MSTEAEIAQVKESMEKLFNSLADRQQVRKNLLNDKAFVDSITNGVIESLISQGLIEDRILTPQQVMDMLGIKTRNTLKRITALRPVFTKDRSRPRYRLSDVNSYIKGLKLS